MSDEAQFDFDLGFQSKIVALTLQDPTFAAQTADLLEGGYFTEVVDQQIMRLALEHVRVYRTAPDPRSLKILIEDAEARKLIKEDERKEIFQRVVEVYKDKTLLTNSTFVRDKVAEFARHQAIMDAVLQSAVAVQKGDYDRVEKLMQTALSVGAGETDDRYDYFAEIDGRSKQREDLINGKVVMRGITSGYKDIDAHLYHYGWGRKELACLMGPAKSGKSLALGDFGKNASLAGHNVLYVSLEVSRQIISDRIDASLSDTLMAELKKDHAKVQAAIKALHAKAGIFEIVDRPSGTFKVSDLRRMLDRYRDRHGIIFDLVIVDYADIMSPEKKSDELRDGLRQIYIDLRGLMHDYDCAGLTATQTNREGASKATAKATDVGDDFNKVRTVDILIGINASDAEKASNEARLYWAVSRNTEDGFSLRIQQDRSRMQFCKKIIAKEK